MAMGSFRGYLEKEKYFGNKTYIRWIEEEILYITDIKLYAFTVRFEDTGCPNFTTLTTFKVLNVPSSIMRITG